MVMAMDRFQLYLSGHLSSPGLTRYTQSIGDGDEFAGDCGNDDLVRFSGLT